MGTSLVRPQQRRWVALMLSCSQGDALLGLGSSWGSAGGPKGCNGSVGMAASRAGDWEMRTSVEWLDREINQAPEGGRGQQAQAQLWHGVSPG